MNANLPSVARLRDVLSYSPEQGVFVWARSVGRRAVVGSVAGGIGNHGYRMIRLDGRKHCAHRLAWLWWYGAPPDGEVDHINGNRQDNRISNLRCVSRSQNMQNLRRARKDNGCGLLGAHYSKREGKWQAKIMVDGKTKSLGYFETPEKAHERYMREKCRVHPFSAGAHR